MTDFQLGNALPNRLPNRRFLPNPVRQFPDVRQIACLLFDLLSTPINKGDRERVRQLGQSETDSQKSEKCGGETSACLTCLTGRNPTPEQPRPPRPPERPHAMTAARYIRRTAASLTDHPELFGKVYWGAFNADKNPEAVDPAIITNRNAFARDWRLKRQSQAQYLPGTYSPSSYDHDAMAPVYDFDHAELYRDETGALVLVCSNYGTTPPPPALGMQEVPPMYSNDATTFAARYPSLKDLRAKADCMRYPK